VPTSRPRSIVVVVATYNECENVRRLIPALLGLHPGLRVLVVDDASPDGTGAAVEELAEEFPERVALLRRSAKLGYGSAFVAGFERALEREPDVVVSMDADWSHDPHALPALIDGLEGADVAVGSRYVGGMRILNWSLGRLLLSRLANSYVSLLLPGPVLDRTSGYRAYRGDVLRGLPLGEISSNGYAFLVEILEHVITAGQVVREIPIVYEDRQLGKSKLDRRVLLESLWRPWVLAIRRLRRRFSTRR
jgi:dolichol-phosphate mannosyltransferase